MGTARVFSYLDAEGNRISDAEVLDRDLHAIGLTRERVLTTALRMCPKGLLVLNYVAKGGIRHSLELDDDELVAAATAHTQ